MTESVSDEEDDWVYNPTVAPTIIEPAEVQGPPQPLPQTGQQPGCSTRICCPSGQYKFLSSD